MMRFAFAFVLACLALACEKADPDQLQTPEEEQGLMFEYDNVDEELWPYFQAYEVAAAERGITVDLSGLQLTGHIAELQPDGTAGVCRYDSDAPNRVTVDRQTWEAVNSTLREYIVFHELGHCDRLRGHLEDTDNQGRCTSIMASGELGCSRNYNSLTRDEHLDELFAAEYYNTWP